MMQYHKIQTVFKRDPDNNFKTLLTGEYALPEFAFLKDNEWVFTEKVDGTNIRIMWDGKNVVLGGKTDNAQIPAFLVERLQNLFCTTPARQRLADKLPDGGCLYGEGYGAKIQKGGGNYNADGVDFVLFDVKVGEWWLEEYNVLDVAAALSISTVPVIGRGTLHEMVARASDGFQSKWGDFEAEGIVARPATELRTRSGHRIITKIKHKDFALPAKLERRA